MRHVRERYFSTDDALMTLAVATRVPGFCVDEVVRYDWELAREIGAPISVHAGRGPVAGRFLMVSRLNELGLLGRCARVRHRGPDRLSDARQARGHRPRTVDDTNTFPVIDSVSTVVQQADTRNVDTVIVNGKILKRGGRLAANLGHARGLAADSLAYLLGQTRVEQQWVQSAERAGV